MGQSGRLSLRQDAASLHRAFAIARSSRIVGFELVDMRERD